MLSVLALILSVCPAEGGYTDVCLLLLKEISPEKSP